MECYNVSVRAKTIAATLVVLSVAGVGVSGSPAEADGGGRVCVAVPAGQPGDLAVVNLTPVNASGPGYGLLISSDVATEPAASNVNFAPGTIDPNVAVAPIGANGAVCYVNSAHADVVMDLLVSITADAYTPTPTGAPIRLADTRIGLAGNRLAAAERRCFPTGAEPGALAVVNLTPLNAIRAGNGVLTSSSTVTAPNASNVNFTLGSIDPNLATAPVGGDGRVCFHNSVHGAVDLVVDLLVTIDAGWYTPTPTSAPVRLIDTRTGLGGSRISPDEARCVDAGATPGDLAVVNLTPLNATAPGYGTLVSSDAGATTVSNVNFAPGTVDPNVAVVPIGPDGDICFLNSEHSTIDLIADLLVTINAAARTTGASDAVTPVRLVDTRGAIPSPTVPPICPTATRCYATTGDRMLTSNDGGSTWIPYQLPGEGGIFQIKCPDPERCIAWGWPFGTRFGVTFVTVDGGLTWRDPNFGRAVDIDCPSDDVCIAVGQTMFFDGSSQRGASITRNRGRDWERLTVPPLDPAPTSAWLDAVLCASTTCAARSVTTANTTTTMMTITTSDGWKTVTVAEA
jgi:hypothetical protein